MAVRISSSAFEDGDPIPVRYTCDGEDVSPPLAWDGAPHGTLSLALICDDPDAPVGTWVHWVIFNIPADSRSLPEGVLLAESGPGGSVQGKNDFMRLGYGGPCPPRGSPHRYFFKLYALDRELALEVGATKRDLLEAMEGHILDEAQLVGTYQRAS